MNSMNIRFSSVSVVDNGGEDIDILRMNSNMYSNVQLNIGNVNKLEIIGIVGYNASSEYNKFISKVLDGGEIFLRNVMIDKLDVRRFSKAVLVDCMILEIINEQCNVEIISIENKLIGVALKLIFIEKYTYKHHDITYEYSGTGFMINDRFVFHGYGKLKVIEIDTYYFESYFSDVEIGTEYICSWNNDDIRNNDAMIKFPIKNNGKRDIYEGIIDVHYRRNGFGIYFTNESKSKPSNISFNKKYSASDVCLYSSTMYYNVVDKDDSIINNIIDYESSSIGYWISGYEVPINVLNEYKLIDKIFERIAINYQCLFPNDHLGEHIFYSDVSEYKDKDVQGFGIMTYHNHDYSIGKWNTVIGDITYYEQYYKGFTVCKDVNNPVKNIYVGDICYGMKHGHGIYLEEDIVIHNGKWKSDEMIFNELDDELDDDGDDSEELDN